MAVEPLFIRTFIHGRRVRSGRQALIFAAYFALMLWLVQGATRFAAFVRVSRELGTMGPVEE